MNSFAKVLVAAAAVLAVAVAGASLLPAGDGIGSGGAGVSPAPVASPRGSPSPPTEPPPEPSPSALAFPPAGVLAAGRHPMIREGIPLTISVPTLAWRSNGDFHLGTSGGAMFFWTHTPDGVNVDPCGHERGPVVGPSAVDLAAAVSTIPGTRLVAGPDAVTVGGYPAQRVVLEIPEDAGCPAEDFYLWYDEAVGDRYASALGDTIAVWIIDLGETNVWIDGETRRGAGAGATDAIQEVIDSIQFGFLVPPAGDLAPGVYGAGFGPGISFALPTRGWTSSGPNPDGTTGPIARGTPGSSDGAVIRFIDNPTRRVFADPCAHTLAPSVGASNADLAAALASIPGLDVTGPSREPLAHGFSSAQHLSLTVRDDIACDPQDFYLWDDEGVGARAAPALGATIRVWIFHPDNRPVFGRVVIEAETYAGATPDIEREIQEIIDSVNHGG